MRSLRTALILPSRTMPTSGSVIRTVTSVPGYDAVSVDQGFQDGGNGLRLHERANAYNEAISVPRSDPPVDHVDLAPHDLDSLVTCRMFHATPAIPRTYGPIHFCRHLSGFSSKLG